MENTMEILRFIFSGFWTWFGSFLMLAVVSSLLKTLVRGRRPKKKKSKKEMVELNVS